MYRYECARRLIEKNERKIYGGYVTGFLYAILSMFKIQFDAWYVCVCRGGSRSRTRKRVIGVRRNSLSQVLGLILNVVFLTLQERDYNDIVYWYLYQEPVKFLQRNHPYNDPSTVLCEAHQSILFLTLINPSINHRIESWLIDIVLTKALAGYHLWPPLFHIITHFSPLSLYSIGKHPR